MKRALLFIPVIILLLIEINNPFLGPYGNNNSTYSLQAKNYIRFGYLKTNFAPLTNPGSTFPNDPKYYINHPPLLQILLSISYRIFGLDNYWAGRFVPVIFTIISIFILSMIIEKLWGKLASYISILLSTVIPMVFIYGKLIQFEPITLTFVLLSVLLLIDYLKTENKIIFIILLFTIVLGFLADWPMIYFSFLLAIIFIWEKGVTKVKKEVITLVALPIILSMLYFIYAFLLLKHEILIQAYLNRSINGPPFNLQYPFLSMSEVFLLRMLIYFTPLGFISGIILTVKTLKEKFELKHKIIVLFIIFPVLYVLLFPNGAWEHPYWLFYFIPIIIFSATDILIICYNSKLIKYILIFIIFINSIFSFSIFFFKHEQTNKALWQENFINNIKPYIAKDKTIPINWDFNDDFLRFKSDKQVVILWDKKKLLNFLIKNPYEWDHFVFSCWANCSTNDLELENKILEKFDYSYKDYKNRAYLLNLNKIKKISIDKFENKTKTTQEKIITPNESFMIKIYRNIRNGLFLEQI